ncbi:MAG: DUF3987 domain-containing protein [Bacteroidetes bacterium]|nr:DUF3987 domain-containing protein [Bacteroidota bacterium]
MLFSIWHAVRFLGGAILAAFSTAIGNSVLLHDGKYRNNTALWFAFVAPTGIGKTEPLSFAFRPFHKLDQIAFTEYETRKALYDSYHNTSAKNRGEMEEPERPALMQYLLSDFTPESLAQVHHDNRRGIIVHRDELMAWINDFGRYNKSGEVQNWLSIWSGEAATYNRKSQNPIKITHPCVSIAGGIQPDLIRSMGADHRAENGLMQRFCFLYPDQTVKPYYNQKRLSTGIEENYDRFIKTLLSIPMDAETILSLTEGAQDLYRDFVNRNTDAINQEKSDHVKGIFSKLEIIVLRLSMILHLASAAISGDIDADINEETMESAIKITEYFRETGIKVYDHFSSGDGLTKAAVAKYLYHKAGLKNQSEIARVLGVSQPYISKVIRL